jgi:hypothetical protein
VTEAAIKTIINHHKEYDNRLIKCVVNVREKLLSSAEVRNHLEKELSGMGLFSIYWNDKGKPLVNNRGKLSSTDGTGCKLSESTTAAIRVDRLQLCTQQGPS